MKKVIICLAMMSLFMFSLMGACYAQEILVDDNFHQRELQKQCLSATITAINLEIDRHQGWIKFRKQQENPKGVAELEESLAALQVDLEKYLAMNAKEYVLPEKQDVIASTGDNIGQNSVLYVAGMSKNGPWYHVAGIVDGDYSALQPKAEYHMNIYLVYPRSYWGMSSSYVYIAQMKESDIGMQATQGKRITGEVFMYKYNVPLYEYDKCENYQIYLLKDTKPGSKGEQILDSKQSSFDVTLSEEQLETYTYMEVVSPFGNKIIKLGEIQDHFLKITLEPQMILKKPAIYLYPEKETQVSVIHTFKGQILTTYPAYGKSWTVIAEPNGNLLNLADQRSYKYLFWDGIYSFPKEHYQFKSGFYVKNEDYVAFLQQKLAMIGLNENEINDFIVYWLPAMNKYPNCFVYFRINDNIDGSSILESQPAADITIRVFMEFASVDDIKTVTKLPEQQLPTFIRKGFTLVEWGGAEIGNSKLE